MEPMNRLIYRHRTGLCQRDRVEALEMGTGFWSTGVDLGSNSRKLGGQRERGDVRKKAGVRSKGHRASKRGHL